MSYIVSRLGIGGEIEELIFNFALNFN